MGDLSGLQNPKFARAYERASAAAEARGTGRYRDRLLAGLRGRVIEIGAGNGLNFPRFPAHVTEVVGVEPEDRLRRLAERAAAKAAVPVRVVAADADDLPFEAGEFDAAVVSLVLCSMPDPVVTLGELRRVLKPGGEVRFFEHVRSRSRPAGLVQDLITPLWSRIAGGCRPNRDTAASLERAGLIIEEIDRFSYRPARSMPSQPHILGRARSPR
ncbi:class I SAM-dependent methyltransferase [Spirillospora sp. NPDC047279]|uniref:class I SAM-dependent methyltransferase n=1 Tax=Spirillospora sp. NPDC047279 TaxID=3155478 RepID=UPI0033F6E048